MIAGAALALYFGKPALEKPMGLRPAYAQQASQKYNPNTDPLKPGFTISAIAKKVRSSSAMESIRKLHLIMKNIKLVSSGKTLAKDDRPPRTAEQTVMKGGDCTEHTYLPTAVLQNMNVPSGAIVLKLGRTLRHVLPFAEINGKRVIIDSQTKDLGKGRAKLSNGKIVSFTYEEAMNNKIKGMSVIEVLNPQQVKGLWHREYGIYLKDQKGRTKEAIAAFKRAVELNPSDSFSAKNLLRLINPILEGGRIAFNLGVKANKRGNIKALKKQMETAATLFRRALSSLPAVPIFQKLRAELEQRAKQAEAVAKQAAQRMNN